MRSTSIGGMEPGAAVRRRPRAAAACAVAALSLLAACAGVRVPRPEGARIVRAHVDAGLAFYEAGDFTLAARRFADAADEARRSRDPRVERSARAAECTAWLRARDLVELGACSARLERLQSRGRRSDPGINTLVALGAIAGNRPPPPLRVPNAVHPIVRAAAGEDDR